MLKKLKRKFILINMLLIGLVVIFVFCGVCYVTYQTELRDTEQALELAVKFGNSNIPHDAGGMNTVPPTDSEAEGSPLPTEIPSDEAGDAAIAPATPSEKKNFSKEHDLPMLGGNDKIPYLSTFTVRTDKDGNILGSFGYGADMDSDVLTEVVSRALALKDEKGTLGKQGLIYLLRETSDGYLLTFASTEPLDNAMKNAMLISGAACIVSLLIFLVISTFLAGLAIKPAEEAWRRQKQFVADASHDLKTPITVILANAGILLSHRNEPIGEQTKWIESTKEEAERMRGLADRMLELARSEDMHEKLIFSDLEISELTEKLILQFEPVAFDKQVSIVTQVEPGLKLRSHEECFVRLMQILLDNAIKYSLPGGEVRVGLHAVRQGMRLTVQNDGSPIPAADLPHIFERFYRADKARAVGGYGLGLAIAKNLAENLGGKISAESSAEKGTVFTVAF